MTTGIFLTNGQWRTYPQGYSYQANTYCPDCILVVVTGVQSQALVGRESVEDALTHIAKAKGIDYADEYSYDSDDFPKVITAEDESVYCDRCQADLTRL